MQFFDEDEEYMFIISDANLEWKKGKGGGWMVLAEDSGGEMQAYHINETLHEMIKEADQSGYNMLAAAPNTAADV